MAEIAVREVIHVVEKLLGKRAIQTQCAPDTGDRGRVRRRSREERVRIAWQRVRYEEGEDDDAHQAGHGSQEAFPDETHQRFALSSGSIGSQDRLACISLMSGS